MTAVLATDSVATFPRVGYASTLLASTRAELLKLGKRPTTWLIASVWLLLNLLFGYVFPYLSSRGTAVGGEDPTAGAEQLLAGALPSALSTTAIAGLPMFGGALAMIFGVLCVGSEYGWGTVKTVLAQRPSRSAVIGGKFAVLAIAMFAIITATFVVDAGVSALVAVAESRALDWPSVTELAKGFGVGLLVISMWCAVGAFLGVLLRGTPVGIGLGLVWALVVENLVRGFASVLSPIDALQKVLPGTNGGALVAALGARTQSEDQGTPGVTDVVSGTHAMIVLACYVVLAVIAAIVVLRRRDVA